MTALLDGTYVLIVGVDCYPDVPHRAGQFAAENQLPGTLNNVRDMIRSIGTMDIPAENFRVLTGQGPDWKGLPRIARGRGDFATVALPEHVLHGATREDIQIGLQWLRAQLEAHPGAQGIIYYSGHSAVTAAGHPCLVPTDARPRRAAQAGSASGMGVDEYQDWSRLLWAMSATWRDVDAALGVVDGWLLADRDVARLVALVTALGEDAAGQAAGPRAWLQRHLSVLQVCVREAGIAQFLPAWPDANDQRYGGLASKMLAAVVPWRAEVEAAGGEWRSAVSSRLAMILQSDPFAEDDELDGLLSFPRAFYDPFVGLPETSRVHIVAESCLKPRDGGFIHPYYATRGMVGQHPGDLTPF